MNHPKAIRPSSFSMLLEPQLNSKPAFLGLNSSSRLRSSPANLQTLSSLKPPTADRSTGQQPAHQLAPKAISPSDSGIFSIGSQDSNDRTMLTPSGITSIHDIWSNDSKLGLLDTYSPTPTLHGEHSFFGASDKLADIWRAPDDQLNSFSLFSNNNHHLKKPTETRLAGRPLLNNSSKLNELNSNDSDAAYEFDCNWNAPACSNGSDLDATFLNPRQFVAPVEQCDHGCSACWTPDEHRALANARQGSINDKRLANDCNRCTDLSVFERLLSLADVIYQANYEEVTYNAESFIDPNTNLPIFMDTKFCRFCKNNKEKREVYLSHTTRNKAGETTCPILMRHICEECGATGAQAHTRSYCPMIKATKNEDLKLAVKLYHGDRKFA